VAVVVFSYSDWALDFPLLAPWVDEAQTTRYFLRAELILNNTDCSPVTDAGQRSLLLNMLVAHIALLNAVINGTLPSGLIGRVTEATEGSVKVSVDAGAMSGSAAWFAQTTPGYEYWLAVAGYRNMRYVPGPVRNFEPFYNGNHGAWRRS